MIQVRRIASYFLLSTTSVPYIVKTPVPPVYRTGHTDCSITRKFKDTAGDGLKPVLR